MPQTHATRRAELGFTLIELLVTLGIIATVAGLAVQIFSGVDDQTSDRLVRLEMREVTSAIQRFRRDTGYFPKDGPFAASIENIDGDAVNDVAVPSNLFQLFFQPVDLNGNAILPYDPATGTGWNGPYLTELDALTVTVGDDLDVDGSGDPLDGNAVRVRGVGDPFSARPAGAAYIWVNGDLDQVANLGRPFFYFNDETASDGVDDDVANCIVPCLVSAGPDGVYEAGKSDGVEGEAPYNGDGDDIVINIGATN